MPSLKGTVSLPGGLQMSKKTAYIGVLAIGVLIVLYHRSKGKPQISVAYHASTNQFEAHDPIHGGVFGWTPATDDTDTTAGMGTIGGAAVKDGKLVLVSNQHVFETVGAELTRNLDEVGTVKIGTVIAAQAGNVGGGYVDCGIASSDLPISADIPGIGVPKGSAEPTVGMNIKLLGAESGLLTGTVTDIYPSIQAEVEGVGNMEQQNVFNISAHTVHGDSGSLIINDEGYVVGQVYAATIGGNQGNETGQGLCSKATVIEAAMGISFDTSTVSQAPPTQTQTPTGDWKSMLTLGGKIPWYTIPLLVLLLMLVGMR